MDIGLKQLEIFRWVVIAGSITKASQRIGRSQPSISQQLARLEEILETQLIVRNRSGNVTLTPAGEYWFKCSEEILSRMAAIVTEHENLFRSSSLVLRLGATPALRGRFTGAAARIAQQDTQFVKFELVYEINSAGLVEQLRMHKINFAIVSEASIRNDVGSFAVSVLYDDQIAWVVPASISEAEIRQALIPGADPNRVDPVLRRYVEIDPMVPTRDASDDWYRNHLPSAMPTMSAQTFLASVEFVAEGLATCHAPLSLLPNLPVQIRNKLRIYEIPGMTHRVVLAMHKHLLSHPSYARIYHSLTAFCRTEYVTEMRDPDVQPLARVLPRQGSEPEPAQAQAPVRAISNLGKSAAR